MSCEAHPIGAAWATGLLLALSSLRCAPGPLDFRGEDSGDSVDGALDHGSGGDASPADAGADGALDGSDASAGARVYLLTRDSPDTTVDRLRSELTQSGIAHFELAPGDAGTIAGERVVMIAGFSSEPAEWESAGATIANSVSTGSWILLEAYALHFLDYMAVQQVYQPPPWQPAFNDTFYFVAPAGATGSELFGSAPTWNPPELPDRPIQVLKRVLTAKQDYFTVHPVGGFGAEWTRFNYWELTTAYGSTGSAPDTEFCQLWPKCTAERWVRTVSVLARDLGTGRIVHINERAHVPDDLVWGPALMALHGGYVAWALEEIEKGRAAP